MIFSVDVSLLKISIIRDETEKLRINLKLNYRFDDDDFNRFKFRKRFSSREARDFEMFSIKEKFDVIKLRSAEI